MNFFDAQDQARRATRWLVVVYVVATLFIVAGVTAIVGGALAQSGGGLNAPVLLATAVVTALFILGATLYKTTILAGGGGRVAQDMGGTLIDADVQDPLRRRLRNVVEEMAIASGVPVPEIYVLEHEAGINAFAAGFSPGDAAVAVTRGALEILDREELQGVIAHEFSHILNGDMRLNIRMMGVLFGIMVLGLIGRTVLRGSYHSGIAYGRRSRNGSAIMAIGLGLSILGWIGVFFARLIKAAVSRQREYLADASAVQFTRQTDGIANALKKIGGYSQHSYLRASDPEEISHMLFAGGVPKLASLFATHPPLTDRIQALDPSFRDSDYPAVTIDQAGITAAREDARGLADVSASPATAAPETPADIVDRIGQPTPEQLAFAKRLHGSIPDSLMSAAHSPHGAYLLTIALMLTDDHAERQLDLVANQLGTERAGEVREYYNSLRSLGSRYWLPLLELSFPALKQRPPESLEFLLDLMRRLVEIDGIFDLREFCYFRIVETHLRQAAAPSAAAHRNRASKSSARTAAIDILAVVAAHSDEDPARQREALAAGLAVFGDWAKRDTRPTAGDDVDRLGQALDIISRINAAGRRSMVEAVTRVVAHDGRMTVTESELLRAVCATLDCPLPPFVDDADS